MPIGMGKLWAGVVRLSRINLSALQVKLAEREGFAACEFADCTLCCWEGHSELC